MNRMLPLAVLFAVGGAGCGTSDRNGSDPNAKYRDVQLTRGMQIADIKQQFGEPDSYRDWWSKVSHDPDPYFGRPQRSPEYPNHVEELRYGPFGAHNQKIGHITKYRLNMTFIDGKLYIWEKSAPIVDE